MSHNASGLTAATTFSNDALLQAAAMIVGQQVAANPALAADIAARMSEVYGQLQRFAGTTRAPVVSAPRASAVAVEDSIQPGYLICLEDGKKLKMLKRYLKTNYNMTPEQYRQRWNLPVTYPMVAPDYAKRRSDLAKDIGLGKVGKRFTPTRGDRLAQAASQRRRLQTGELV